MNPQTLTQGQASRDGGAHSHGESRFLPSLDYSRCPSPDAVARWSPTPGGADALRRYAAALEVGIADLNPQRFKSIPSPWARLLLFEHALFEETHPAHGVVLREWRGLLGAMALADYLPYQLTAKEVRLSSGSATVLRDLQKLAPTSHDPAWERTGVLYVDGRPVGATSPLTLVFTGLRSVDPGVIPFFENGRLTDPVPYFRRLDDLDALKLLGAWISRLLEDIDREGAPIDELAGNRQAAVGVTRSGQIRGLLEEWRAEIGSALGHSGATYRPTPVALTTSPLESLFDSHPASVLRILRPAAAPERTEGRCDLHLRGSAETVVDPGRDGLLVDRHGQAFSGPVVLTQGFAVDSEVGRLPFGTDVSRLSSSVVGGLSSHFQDHLIPTTEVVAENAAALQIGDRYFLLPFKAEVLEQVSPDQLAEWTSGSGDPTSGYEVHVDVPVERDLRVRWTHRYGRDRVIDKANTPSLATWPDFRADGWSHYYYALRHGAAANRLQLEPAGLVTRRVTSPAGLDEWGHTDVPVRAWRGQIGQASGLLVARELPERVAQNVKWNVSIDFGSTHTRAFRRSSADRIEPIDIVPRAIRLIGGAGDLPFTFFPGLHADVGRTEELRTLVRLPAGRPTPREDRLWMPIDGIIFWQELTQHGSAEGLHPNLKWHEKEDDLPAFRSYATQFFLSILAEAYAAGARVETLVTAFPSVFPRHLRTSHEREWGEIARTFGVPLGTPQPESVALAGFLVANTGGAVADNLLAIDVGGSTSDLAVWADSRLRSNDSVRLAGDVLSRLMLTDEAAREAVRAAANRTMRHGEFQWHERADMYGLVFNSLLRAIAKQSDDGSTTELAKALYQGPESAGARVIAHAGFLYAAVSYLIGLMARREQLEYREYALFFAGRGSQFLPWLNELTDRGAREIPRTFFLAGLGAQQQPVTVRVELPSADTAKHEVGRGLLEMSVAGVDESPREHVTFLGETGFSTADEPIEWTSAVSLDDLAKLENPGNKLQPENLAVLRDFLAALRDTGPGRAIARALGCKHPEVTERLRGRILQKIFGPATAWAASRSDEGQTSRDRAMLEPFFIMEAKAFLEDATDNPRLFNG